VKRLVLSAVLLLAGAARAQDMPLSQILIEGEGWRAVEKSAAPTFPDPARTTSRKGMTFTADGLKGHGPASPSGVVLWPDEGTLVVGDRAGKHLWAFRVEKDGSLTCGERYYALRVKPGQTASGVTALTADSAGRLYACTPLGVQVFDPTGRLSGVLLKPGEGDLTAIAFGGEKHDTLFVLCGGKVYARKTQARGAASR
jgi:sugar lactone lactonase YvrE